MHKSDPGAGVDLFPIPAAPIMKQQTQGER